MAVFRKICGRAVLSALFIFIPLISFAAQAPMANVLVPVSAGIKSPVRLAVDGKGSFYVTDPKTGTILKYALSGQLQPTAIPFTKPQGLAVTASGDLVVSHGDTVSIIDSQGTVKKALGKGAGQFKSADGIAIDSAGYIYVADSGDNTVQVFNAAGISVNMAGAANGKPANSFGSDGSANGQFSMPTGIAYEKSSGQIAVVDTLNRRVQFFDNTGIWKKTIGGTGSSVSLTMPVSVDFDYNPATGALQRMYIADSFQSGVQVIDPASPPVSLGYIGGYGKSAGKLMNPYGAVIDKSSSTLLVANGYGNVSLWGIDGGGSPPVMPPPGIVIDAFPGVTSSADIILTGTTDAGVKLTAATDTTATAGTPQLNGTVWMLPVSGLLEGLNTISVTATDAFGSSVTRTALITYSRDAVAFTINRVTTPTNLTSQTITGTMEAGSTVTVGGVPATMIAPSTWSYTVSSLTSGDNLIRVSASLSGKVTSSATVTITVKPAPGLTLFMVPDGSTVSSPLLSVNGETDPDITTVSINGQQSAVSNGTFSRSIMLTGGSNTITVSLTDALGSTTTRIRNVTYDPVTPAFAITSPSAGAVMNSLAPLQVQGTFSGSAGSTIRVNGVSAVINGTTWRATVTPIAGVYGITVVTTDGAKQSTASTFVNFVDLTQPAISISSPSADLLTATATTAVSGNAKGAVVTARLNGAPLTVTFDPVSGDYSATVSPAQDDTYLLAITTTNAFGTASTVFRTIVYKTTAPKLTVTTQSSTAVSGAADAGATVYVKNATGVEIGRAIANANGNWTISFTGVATPPLNIYALDAVGNNSRNGDVNVSGAVDINDALKILRLSVGVDKPTSDELLHGDVAPLKNGMSVPDGRIDIDDVMLVLMRVVGQSW